MAVQQIITLFFGHTFPADSTSWPVIAVLLVFFVLTTRNFFSSTKAAGHIPLVNPPKFYDIGAIWAKIDCILHARRLLARGVSSGRPFRLLTDLGEMIVLPAHFATEIRSDPRLSFAEVIEQVRTRAYELESRKACFTHKRLYCYLSIQGWTAVLAEN